MKLRGVYPATVTPFDTKGQVCYASLEKLFRRLASEGVSGFVPCATTGEGPVLSDSERNEILKLAVSVSKEKGLLTIAGCNSNDTAKVVKLVDEAVELGCKAALVVTPYYNKPTQAGLIAHYRHIADRSPLPIVLYNVPGRTAVNLLPETALELFAHPKIIGIKEASGNLSQWLALSAKMDLEQKSFLAGDDDALATIMSLGGCGIISASANVTAKPFVAICQAAEAGNWAIAYDWQKRVLPLVKAMFLETNPSPAKHALKLLGQCEEHVRLPLVPVSPAAGQAVRESLKQLELL